MVWIKKTFPLSGPGWCADLTRFDVLLETVTADGTDAYRKMLMLAVRKDDDPDREDIYVQLPVAHAPLFPGYAASDPPPSKVTRLLGAGDTPEFHRDFTVPNFEM